MKTLAEAMEVVKAMPPEQKARLDRAILGNGAPLRSAGYQDMDAAPIVPSPPEGMAAPADPGVPANTNPMTPANPQAPASPAVGMNQGIETPAADGAM